MNEMWFGLGLLLYLVVGWGLVAVLESGVPIY
jgi:hypothetical protein